MPYPKFDDQLQPGDKGYWPVIGAIPDDIRPDDRLSFPDGTISFVKTVLGSDGKGWPVTMAWVDETGETMSIGRLNRTIHVDRYGTHATLAASVR